MVTITLDCEQSFTFLQKLLCVKRKHASGDLTLSRQFREPEKNSYASKPTTNNSEPSSNLSNKTFKDILQKFLKGNDHEFKAILPDLKKVYYVLSSSSGLID